MRKSIATVSVGGTLAEKLEAIAAAVLERLGRDGNDRLRQAEALATELDTA